MVTTAPPARGSRRRRLEFVIYCLDVTTWAAWLGLVGVGIIVNPTLAMQAAFGGNTTQLYGFAALFLIGGAYGFIVRLARLGILELPAICLAITGLLIYGVILIAVIPKGVPWMVGLGICVASLCFMFRRWADLEILAGDRGSTGLLRDVRDLLRTAATRD